MIGLSTLNRLTGFFSTFNYKKALMFILNPLILMYNNYWYLFIGLFVVVMVDLRFGIRAYCKEHNVKLQLLKPSTWGIIKSSGLRKTLAKLKDYLFLAIAVFFIEEYMLKGHEAMIFGYTITHIAFLILAAVEMWSIGEKFKKIRGYNFVEYLVNIVLRRDLDKVVDSITTNNEEGDNQNT